MICFLDDDNEPSTDYLRVGLSASRDPRVGLLVSRVYPAYELLPPPAVRRRQHLFALNYQLGDEPVRWPAEIVACPTVGAGMWIRKEVFEAIQDHFGGNFLPDRIGDTLISGGDIELGITTGKLGYDRMYVPGLVLRHHIPRRRLEFSYVNRLITGIVRCEATLEKKYGNRTETAARRGFRLLGAVGLGWIFALARGDTLREYGFIVAAAWARWLGPIA